MLSDIYSLYRRTWLVHSHRTACLLPLPLLFVSLVGSGEMEALGWWLMLVGSLRLASVWFGFFDIWALRMAVFSKTQSISSSLFYTFCLRLLDQFQMLCCQGVSCAMLLFLSVDYCDRRCARVIGNHCSRYVEKSKLWIFL